MASNAINATLEPSENDHSTEDALGNGPEPIHTAIRRKPCPVSAYVPAVIGDSASQISSPPHSPVSSLSIQSSVSHDIPCTSNTNSQPTPVDLAEKQGQLPKDDNALEKARLWSRLVADWWVLEIAAAVVSLAAIASIFGVLMAYDDKPVPPLAHGITVRTAYQFVITHSDTHST